MLGEILILVMIDFIRHNVLYKQKVDQPVSLTLNEKAFGVCFFPPRALFRFASHSRMHMNQIGLECSEISCFVVLKKGRKENSRTNTGLYPLPPPSQTARFK